MAFHEGRHIGFVVEKKNGYHQFLLAVIYQRICKVIKPILGNIQITETETKIMPYLPSMPTHIVKFEIRSSKDLRISDKIIKFSQVNFVEIWSSKEVHNSKRKSLIDITLSRLLKLHIYMHTHKSFINKVRRQM